MTISWNALVQIWMSPVYARLNLGSMRVWYWIFGLLLLLSELLALGMYTSKPSVHTWTIFPLVTFSYFGIMPFLIAVVWFFVLAQYILKQYSPSNAKLTPFFRQHMQLALLLPMILFSSLATIVYYFIEHKISIMPAAHCALLMFAIISMWRGFMGLIFFIGTLEMPRAFERYQLETTFQRVGDYLPWGASWSFLLLSMILVTFGLYWFFALSEKNLFSSSGRDKILMTQLGAVGLGASGVVLPLSGLSQRWMDYCVQRQSESKTTTKKSPEFLPFCFGPNLHWTSTFLQTLCAMVMLVALVLAIDLLQAKPQSSVLGGVSIFLYCLVGLSSSIVYGLVFFQTIYKTRGEQAIVGLAPFSGNSQRQDRVIRRYFIRQFLILFALSFLCCLAFFIAFEVSRKGMSLAILFLTCQFPLLLPIADDYAEMRAENDHSMKAYVIASFALFVFFSIVLLSLPVVIVWPFVALIMGGTLFVFLMASRLKRDRRTFPVGRAV